MVPNTGLINDPALLSIQEIGSLNPFDGSRSCTPRANSGTTSS